MLELYKMVVTVKVFDVPPDGAPPSYCERVLELQGEQKTLLALLANDRQIGRAVQDMLTESLRDMVEE